MKKLAFSISIFIVLICGIFYFYKSDDNRYYTNEKFGYRLEVPKGWSIPLQANANIDLMREYISDPANKDIYSTDDVITDPIPPVTKDPLRVAELNKRFFMDLGAWNPTNADFIMLTNTTADEQSQFYEDVNKKEKTLIDFFPNRTIHIEPSNHIVNDTILATTTATIIKKIITLPNGLKAEYRKVTRPAIAVTMVYVPIKTNRASKYVQNVEGGNGEINSLLFVYLKNEISEDVFMDVVNSLTYTK